MSWMLSCPVDKLPLQEEGAPPGADRPTAGSRAALRCENRHCYDRVGSIVDLQPGSEARGFGRFRAATYDLTFDFINVRRLFGATPRLLVELHQEAARAATGGVLLDVACGTSRWAIPQLGPAGVSTYIGVDSAMPMLRLAEQRARRASGKVASSVLLVHSEAQRLPIGAGTVDAVLSSLGLQFVEDHAAALAELRRVLRPGGRLFVVAPALGRRDRYDRRHQQRAHKDYPIDFACWPSLLAAAGFADLTIATVGALVFTRAR
jgi:SAM-dependent methyltransferase